MRRATSRALARSLRRSARRSRIQILSTKVWRIRLVFWFFAVALGVISTLFAMGAQWADETFHQGVAQWAWLPFVVAPAGLMLASWLTRTLFPGSQGSGIPQTIAALALRSKARREPLLSPRIVVGKILLTLLGLLSGASIGREGPTVHVGASLLYSAGRWAKFRRHEMERGLILAGGAAGIAAAFNAPLAGIVFAIEEMSRSFEARSNGTVITAVVFAGATALAILGDYVYFGSAHANFGFDKGWIVIPVCGVVGGLFGGLFSSSLVWGSRYLAPYLEQHPLRVAALCGLGIATLGLLSGGLTYGTGYNEARAIITGEADSHLMLPLYKALATAVSYVSGIPGGIFSPSLATGAALGADLARWLPMAPAAAVILLGMVAYFAGVVQTPITAFVIIVEMTDSRSMVLPLIATAFIAHATSRLVCDQPIYRTLAEPFMRSPRNAPVEPPTSPQG